MINGRLKTLVKHGFVKKHNKPNSKRPCYVASDSLFSLLKDNQSTQDKRHESDEKFKEHIKSRLTRRENEIRINLKSIKELESVKEAAPERTDVVNNVISRVVDNNEDLIASIKALEMLTEELDKC